jgi:hypothetical protein
VGGSVEGISRREREKVKEKEDREKAVGGCHVG